MKKKVFKALGEKPRVRFSRFVGVLGCLLAFMGGLRADVASLQTGIVESQRAYFATLTAKNAVEAVPAETDVRAVTRDFAANYLPAALTAVDGEVTLAMDDRDAKIGSMRLKGGDGTDHLFTSWVTKKLRKPFCWMGEGYAANGAADVAALRAFLSATVLAAQPGSQYIVKGTAAPIGQNVAVRGAFTKKPYAVPFERAFVAFVDDNPLANWGHAARLVFVKDDLTAFVAWYVNEPVKVVADGADVALEDVCGNVELPPPPTIGEMRNALKEFDKETGLLEENIRTTGGDTSHSYAILISGGYNIYNNHTRYWGDVAAVYSTLTRKYGIPKSHIKVCMSDGTSSSADVSTDYYSYSHSSFSGNSSPLDLDGDGSADVGYSATRSSIQSAFSSFRNSLTSSDQLFVFATDHGSEDDSGNAYICLWGEDEMSVSSFASLTSGMACPVAYAFEFCYSGAFISTLRSQGGTRIVATAASDETSSAWSRTSSVTGIGFSTGIYYMDPWVYYFVGALRGYFPQVSVSPWNDGTSCSADTTGDNCVSIREASDYASNKIRADGYPESPNYGESSSGTGSSFFLAKGLSSGGGGSVSLSTALDVSGLSISTGGSTPAWFGQTSIRHDGVDAARSGAISHSQTNWFQTTVSGAGTVSFYWMVSSESGYDYLEFLVDNTVVYSVSGTNNTWTLKTYTISSSGSHTLKWRYRKDISVSIGYDAGFVDQLTWAPDVRTTITLGKNSGTGGTSSVTATYGESMPSITPPTRSGYVFDGYWDTVNNGTKYYNANGTSAHVWDKRVSTCTLWAKWVSVLSLSTVLESSLSFTTGGDAPAWYGQTGVTHDGVDAARSGAITHSQTTWFQTTVNSAGTVSFWWRVDSEECCDKLEFIVDNTVVYSIGGASGTWEQKTYTISSSGSHTLRWSYRKDGSVSTGLDAGFVDQLTWRGNTTAITFGKNSGTGGTSSTTATYGSAMPSITPPTRSGYVFDGYWDTVNNGTKYYNADGSSAHTWDKNVSSCTLWAKWIRAYTVTFGKNGGTGGSDRTQAAVGRNMPAIVIPARSGWTFGGYWSTTGENGVKYYNADGSSAHVWDRSANTTLWALWYRSSCTVTLGKNGGSNGNDTIVVHYGQPMPRITPPTRSGYVFDGYWTTVNNGVKYYNPDGSSARNWDKPDAQTATLWAKWIKAYTVTFGKNGGTGGSDRTTQAVVGKPMPTIVIPARQGWTFGGYWTTTGSGGVMYYDAQGRSARNWDRTSNTTLWALWTKTYRLTFGKNGGTGGTSSITVSAGRTLPSIIIPTKQGYRFGGYWTTTGAGGVQYYDEGGFGTRSYDLNADTTLWAFWYPLNAHGNAALHPSLRMQMPADGYVAAAGVYSGVLEGDGGLFTVLLDESLTEASLATGYISVFVDGDTEASECEVYVVGDTWIVSMEDGTVFVVSKKDGGLVAQRRE